MTAARANTLTLVKLPLLLAKFVKIEHSVFALPFAYAGAFMVRNRIPAFEKMFWITVAMVAARSLAMALNRIIDMEIDARNPRTAARELPAGRLTLDQAISFCAISLAALAVALYELPPLTWYLSPLVIAAFVIYPFTKRFTALCHLFLGATIGLAPVGAWVAVSWKLSWQPFLLMGAVTFWIAGFDIIYACLDIDFDRREGIHSLPASLGPARALLVTKAFHLIAAGFLVAAGMVKHLGAIYFAGVAVVALLLAWQNIIASARGLPPKGAAFMTMNGVISIVYIAFLTADLLV